MTSAGTYSVDSASKVRALAKRAVRAVFGMLAIAFVMPYLLERCLLGRDRAFVNLSQRVSRFSGLWGAYLRRAVLRFAGADIAQDCHIEIGTLLSKPSVRIGSGAYIGAYCCLGEVRIGRKTMIADGVKIPSGRHTHGTERLDVPMADQSECRQTVTIGDDCWIGANAVVMADVGDNAIVAAGAVVTHPVPPAAVVAGVPARVISRRDEPRPDRLQEANNVCSA